MTRQDAAIGDNRNFQADLYDQLLNFVDEFGDNSTITGPRSIVNQRVMAEFKFKRFTDSQAADKQLEYHIGRFSGSYGEASFTLNFFANGTDEILTVPTMTSFRDQTFPANWNRRSGAGLLDKIGNDAGAILTLKPVQPGANDVNGVYVPDTVPFGNCSFYNSLADDIPAVLSNTTGLLGQNVDFLLETIHNVFGTDCPAVAPRGAANV